MHDRWQGVTSPILFGQGCENDVHMVAHNTKSVQFEDVSIAVMQTVYHQLGNSRIAEPTRTTLADASNAASHLPNIRRCSR